MPLRQDSSLWFNLPGVVAAYQPVCAPGPLLARYNQAMGGIDRYKAVDGVAPVWSPFKGWTFDGATQFLNTSYVPVANQQGTYLIRFSGGASDTTNRSIMGAGVSVVTFFPYRAFGYNLRQTYHYGTGGDMTSVTSGIMGISGIRSFYNGKYVKSVSTATGSTSLKIFIGATNNAGSMYLPWSGNVIAFSAYSRNLSDTEMWAVSRQMAYCDVNSDWSAWGRRRQWFYLAPSFLAAWASRNNQYIGPGQGTSL